MSTRIAILASLLLALVIAPVARAAVETNGTCVSPANSHFFQGNQDVVHSGHATAGAKATIDIGSGASFAPCDVSGSNTGGALAWVAIFPLTGVTENTILQIGIIRCNNPGNGAICDGTLHYFWAAGGCGGLTPLPQDLGAATSGPHSYAVQRTSTTNYALKIGSTTKINISTSDLAIKCWIGGTRRAEFFGERWDLGDSVGSTGYKMTFTGTQYYEWGIGYHNTAWPSGNCPFNQADGPCVNTGGTSFQGWNS